MYPFIRAMQLAFDGPGLGNLTYTDAELFKPLFTFKESNGARKGHSNVAMHKGYLIVPGAPDSGFRGGGFAAFNVSNPRDPKLIISKFDATTEPMREAHSFGFSSSYPGDYVVMQTINGIIFWDWTDIANPKVLSRLSLPGVQESDYTNGAWWLSWQAPYVFVGGSSNGLYVVDAKNPRAPVLLKQIPKSRTGGFNVGSIFAIGNLLVAGMPETGAMSVLDISDPVNPKLLDQHNGPANYSILAAGNKIYGAGTDGAVYGYDFTDPTNIIPAGKSPVAGGKGGYLSYQDGYVFLGASSNTAKIDVRTNSFTIAGRASSNIGSRDEDFAAVLGNLVFLGNDHGNGSVWVPHQKAPDLKGPSVLMVSPKNNATSQALTSRIGLSMSDNIDLRTISSTTFIVRPVGGVPVPGKFSHFLGIVNFCPDSPLLANTVYEVILTKGGVKDISGNATEVEFYSKFSTGTSLPSGPTAIIVPAGAQETNKAVTFEAKTSGAISGTVTYKWNFGDGTPEVTTTSAKTTHVYTKPGHYIIKLEARDNAGAGNDSDQQTIFSPITGTAPVNSSTLLFDATTNKVWSTNPDNNTVAILDAVTYTKTKEMVTGKHPRTLAKAPDGKIWVANQDDATISMFSPEGNLVKTIPLPYASQPYGIVFSPNQAAAYVTLQATGKLLKLDKTNGDILSSISIGTTPRAIAISGDSKRLFVTRFISPEGQGEVIEVDAVSFTVKRKIALAHDDGADSEASGRGVPNYLNAIAITPDGTEAWVTAKKDNVKRGKFTDGQALTFENTVRSMVARVSLSTNSESQANRIDLDNRDSPMAIAFSKLGDYAFVAAQGNNLVEVRDVYKGSSYAALENTGSAPRGIVLSPDGTKLFVQNFLSRTVTVYNISAIVNSQSNSAPKLADISTVGAELLAPEVLKGKKLFYSADLKMTQTGYISCASCHLDGGEDGRNWDFTDRGEGIRNTIALNGRAGTGHGRMHWSANFDEVQDFENDIRLSFKGTGFMTDANFASTSHTLGTKKAGLSPDLDALAAYVSSLSTFDKSPYKNSNGTLTEDAIKGKAIFENLKCATCHTGNAFTDSDKGYLHDVGTSNVATGGRIGTPLLGLDVPTLRDVWKTAPYLHDGSAGTLYEVLTTKNQQGKHGSTASLSRQETDELIAYLKQIDGLEPAPSGAGIELKLSSPLDNAIYATGTSVNLSISTSLKDITEVIYYANGVEIARTATSPFTAQWKGKPNEKYEIQAKAMHGNLSTVTPEANVTYKAIEGVFFSSVTAKSGLSYQIARTMEVNMAYRTDRTYTIEEVPTAFSKTEIILSPMGDKEATDASFLTIQIAQQGVAYVGYDPRATSLPDWLKTWAKTDLILKTSDQDFVIYQKNVSAGTLTLGANKSTGSVGASSNYVVLGKPSAPFLFAKLVSPLEGASFSSGAAIQLATNISPTSSDAVKVDYYANFLKIGSSSTAPDFGFTWNSAPVGSPELMAIAIDKDGNAISSNKVGIKVNGTINQKPTITLVNPTPHSAFNSSESITANVEAKDLDGAMGRVDYYLNEKYLGSTSTSPFDFSFTLTEAGPMVLTAVAVDDKGLSSEPSLGIDFQVKSPLGLDENEIGSSFNVAPIPAKDFLLLSNVQHSLSQAVLIDMKGRRTNRQIQQISENAWSIDVAGCTSGLYVLEVRQGEVWQRRKIVILQ